MKSRVMLGPPVAILLNVVSGRKPWLPILGTSLRPTCVFPECSLPRERHKIHKAFCELVVKPYLPIPAGFTDHPCLVWHGERKDLDTKKLG